MGQIPRSTERILSSTNFNRSDFQHIPNNFRCRFRRVRSYDKEGSLGQMSTLGLDGPYSTVNA